MKKQNLGLQDFSISSFCNLHGPVRHIQCRFDTSTVVIFVPLWDEDLNDFTPTLLERGSQCGLGDWLRCYPRVRIKYGADYLTIIPYDPVDLQESRDHYYNNPFVILWNSIRTAINTEHLEHYRKLIEREGGGKQIITFDQQRYFAPVIYLGTINDLVASPRGLDTVGPFYLLELSKTAGEALKAEAISKRIKLLFHEVFVVAELVPTPAGHDSLSRYRVRFTDPTKFFDYHNRRDLYDTLIAKRNEFLNRIRNEKFGWSSFLRELSKDEQFNIILHSAIPPAVLEYAFTGTDYESKIPKSIRRMAHMSPENEQQRFEETDTNIETVTLQELERSMYSDLEKL